MTIQWVQLTIFIILFALVTVLGFVASRWKAGANLDHLDEWGLGGRKFGAWITWFLLGGDLYTAYTFVAVPALVFSAGALGMYALPYTIVVYPIVLLPALRNVYPSITSQFVLLLLGSSLASQVSAEELFHAAGFVESRSFRSFEVYAVVCAMYLAMVVAFKLLFAAAGRLAFRWPVRR